MRVWKSDFARNTTTRTASYGLSEPQLLRAPSFPLFSAEWVENPNSRSASFPRRFAVAAVLFACGMGAAAQTADEAWLRSFRLRSQPRHGTIPVRALGSGAVEHSAAQELVSGLKRMNGNAALLATGSQDQTNGGLAGSGSAAGALIVGTADEVRKAFPEMVFPRDLHQDEYWIGSAPYKAATAQMVIGGDERGTLYGVFDLLRHLPSGDVPFDHSIRSRPAMPIRWVDEWDNPDGSIERGYAGRSIFFEGGNVRDDLAPVGEYARLLASVGINGCNINNVNAAPQLLDVDHLKQIARLADAMRPWGVRLAMSVDIASPQKIGGLATFDPLDPEVKAWWAAKVAEIYTLVPDFAGLTVKADSEGQAGPSSYGRTPADAANLLAGALALHGGVVLYRAFVYNHHLDWRDPKADRARAAYDIFHPLDGKFAANVVVQIKEGPIDFQAREPVSPLFAGLRQTSMAMEVEITQEYTGQQRHLVYLAPMWKQVLDFDLHSDARSTPVKDLIAGKSFHQPTGGMIGVAGVGREAWLGSPLAMANLYAFGRLAWDPDLKPDEIAAEWTQQTLGADADVVATVDKMLMQSWPAYEGYTGPLGMQTLTDITGSHYGPNIESSERNGWGQWHNADHEGVGMDRTVATGTGYAGQYPPEVSAVYESLATCPDNLLLFFHHVPYTYRLHSGKTVIQHIYDSHYEGAEQAARLVDDWDSLKGRIDDKVFADVNARLEYQAGHAIVWRDAIVQYFLKLSGIPDEKGRAGHFPGRFEAENAQLKGYKVIDVTPWEDASGGKAVSCEPSQPTTRQGTTSVVPNSTPNGDRALAPEGMQSCSAEWTYSGAPGRFNIAVQYFDLQAGIAKFTLDVNGKPVAAWAADATLPSRRPHGDNSTRFTVRGVELKLGDVLRVVGTPDGNDPATLDYIELIPARR